MIGDAALYWRKPNNVKRAYVDGRYGQMHYRIAVPPQADTTEHPPIIFFHQSPSSGRPFEGLVSEMGRDRIAIAVDTPGFGDSDAPPSPPIIADYAAAMASFLDALNIGEVDVFGDHTGAKVAVELSLQQPDRVRRLVFNACPVYSPEKMAEMMEHLEAERPKDVVPEDGSHILHRWGGMKGWYKPDAPMELYNRDFCESLRGLDLAWYGHNAAFAVKHSDNLPHVSQPILILCPDDGLWDATIAAGPYLKNGRILELPQFGMGAISQHSTEIARILREFLDEPAEDDLPREAPLAAPPAPTIGKKSVRRRFVDTRAGQVHIRLAEPENSARVPVMLLHMSPVSSRNFVPQLERLGADRLAFAADIPGFGESEAPTQLPSIGDLADIMTDVIKEVGGGEPIDLMGDHTGAVIAIDLAARYPELIRKVALNTVPYFGAAARAERVAHSAYTEPAEDGAHLSSRWQSMARIYGPYMDMRAVETNFVEALRGGPFGHWGHHAVFSYDMDPVLPKITQPVLVFRPKDGLEENTLRAKPLIKNVNVIDLLGYGYGFMETQADEVAEYLRTFYDS
jgi:pimeloyl-ACP methyl ester carboxylesterase